MPGPYNPFAPPFDSRASNARGKHIVAPGLMRGPGKPGAYKLGAGLRPI